LHGVFPKPRGEFIDRVTNNNGIQMRRIAILVLATSIASIAQAATISVELEVAGSNWGSLSIDTATGAIVDSDLKMPYGAGTPESPNGWNNFTPVTGALGWQIVAPDLALLTLPERIVTQLTAIEDPHSPDGYYWQDWSIHQRYVTNILFQPSTLIGLDRDLFMSHEFEGYYGVVSSDLFYTHSQSGSQSWMQVIYGSGWDDDGHTHGYAQDIWLRVPEPSSMVLALVGCLAFTGVAFRRTRTQATQPQNPAAAPG
jgi:hypothetical protein